MDGHGDQRYGACPLRSARRRLRSLGDDPLVRAGSALAALPRRARARRAGRARAGCRHGHRRDRPRARAPLRLPRRRRRPVAADARRRARAHRETLADRHRAAARQRRDARPRGGVVRRPHHRLPPALPRRPPADDARPAAAHRPGAPFALLDFAVPPNSPRARPGISTPASACRCSDASVSPGWGDVGRYLRPSITRVRREPARGLRELLTEAARRTCTRTC